MSRLQVEARVEERCQAGVLLEAEMPGTPRPSPSVVQLLVERTS